MPALTATVFPDEAYVLVQTDWSGVVFRDTFQRVSASGWTPADTGQPYTIVSGVAADFTINGNRGLVSHGTVGTDRIIIADVNMTDVRFSGFVSSANIPAGATMEIRFFVRYVDSNNFIDARLFLPATPPPSINIRQRVGGVETTTGFPALPTLGVSGTYGFTLEAIGTNVRLRIWDAALPEPSTWNLSFVTTLLSAGDIGIGSTVPGGVTTPTPIIFEFDDLVASDPNATTADCAIVTRRNTITGEVVQLRPYTSYDQDGGMLLDCGQGLWWDTEPPLNVPLEYCTLACDAAVLVSQNPSFEVDVSGWAVTGGTFTQDCTVAKVGLCSGRLTPTGSNNNPTVSQSGFSLVADSAVTMSTWAMSPQGWNSVLLRLAVTYADLTVETLETPYVTLDDNEWRFLSFTFTPSQTVTTATFSFIAAGLPPNTTLFNVDDLKVTQLTESTLTDCVTVTVESDSVWLKSPLHPCSDIEVGLCSPMIEDCDEDSRVSYVGTSDETYAPNTIVLDAANRRRPIPINRVRRDAAATLRLLAHDCEAKDAVLLANEPGSPLLFQAPAVYCIPDRYISVGTVEESRFSIDQRDEFRLMTLPYVTVDRPEGPADGVCGARIEDLCDIYTSWNALAAAGLSYTDLLLGQASPNGPGQPEPPAGQRTWDMVEAEFTDWDDVEGGGSRDWNELRDGL